MCPFCGCSGFQNLAGAINARCLICDHDFIVVWDEDTGKPTTMIPSIYDVWCASGFNGIKEIVTCGG